MSMALQPKAGFDWRKVTWGRPDSPRSALCSYCSAAIPEYDVPLMMQRAWRIVRGEAGTIVKLDRQPDGGDLVGRMAELLK
jgi:hypothetical protein